MIIIVDRHPDAFQVGVSYPVFIDTINSPLPQLHGAAVGVTYPSIVAFLMHMNATKSDRTLGGWDVVNQLPGELAPMTRWARLVAAASALGADPVIKALNLTGT